MGKTRDLFKKTRDTKGTFHAKMGSLKDRNGMDYPKVPRHAGFPRGASVKSMPLLSFIEPIFA